MKYATRQHASAHEDAKTVGIITFHASFNYGSALQAFALQDAVSSIGYSPEIIDYRSSDYERYRLQAVQVDFFEASATDYISDFKF